MKDLYSIAKIKPYNKKIQVFYSELFPICNSLPLLTHIAYESSWGRYAIPNSNNLFNLRATKTWSGNSVIFGGRSPVYYRTYPDLHASIQDFLHLIKTSAKYPALFKSLNTNSTEYFETLCQGYYPKTALPRLLSIHNDLRKVHEAAQNVKNKY